MQGRSRWFLRIGNSIDPKTTLGRYRVVGILLLIVIFGVFFTTNRFPKLDTVKNDVNIATQVSVHHQVTDSVNIDHYDSGCFQGFCIEEVPNQTLLQRWWDFSISYLRLVTAGMVFAFLVAGIAATFLAPSGEVGGLSRRGLKGSLHGLAVGPPMTLCSGCIVPVANSFREKGASLESTISITQGSSTLNLPAIVMTVAIFSPMLVISRIGLSVAGALLIGPAVGYVVERRANTESKSAESDMVRTIVPEAEVVSWATIARQGIPAWLATSFRFFYRLAPAMVVAGFASGLAIQWLTPDSVSLYLGNHLLAVFLAATVGVLINVPLMFEIPLVAGLMLLGMGTAPSATLLFAAAAAGPVTYWGLARQISVRGAATLGAATWLLAMFGGLTVLGAEAAFSDDDTPGRVIDRPNATELADAALNDPLTTGDLSVYESESVLRFTRVTDFSGLSFAYLTPFDEGNSLLQRRMAKMRGGGAAIDFNNDSLPDLFLLGGGLADDALFKNNGDGTFTDIADRAGLQGPRHLGSSVAAGDFNGDGWVDLFVASHGPVGDPKPGYHRLYQNNGDNTFTDIAGMAGLAYTSKDVSDGFGAVFGDYDLDGDLDLFVAGWSESGSGNKLFRNNGDSTFSDVTDASGLDLLGVRGFSPCFVDTDGDRYPELLLVADFASSRYFVNEGNGTFTNATSESATGQEWSGMGTTIGDFNNDGLIDWYATAIFDAAPAGLGPGNKLYINQGHHRFEEVASEAGVDAGGWGWGAVAVDLNHDRMLDLVEVNGWHFEPVSTGFDIYRSDPARLWLAQPNGIFTDIATAVSFHHSEMGLTVIDLDYDSDGDRDLAVTAATGGFQLFRNDLSGANTHWLAVDLDSNQSEGLAPRGVGAVVRVRAGDVWLTRTVGGCVSYLGHGQLTVHFGLGSADVVDELVVEWPNGTTTEIVDLPADQRITIKAG